MFVGIDVGSLTAKAVLIDDQGTRFSFLTETGDNPKRSGEKVFEEVIKNAGAKGTDIKYIIGTGYGRVSLSFADCTITELTCHAKGAYYLNPAIRTLIDIGGQDSKVIRLNQNGGMTDFVMNDKCAAGTGRFLEVMAGALKVDLKKMGDFSLLSQNPSMINSICTVFAESEVISLLASGQAKEDIIAGLHHGIAKRVGNMARRLGIKDEITFVGGVSKNTGLKSALETYLEINFAPVGYDPQIIGALGAALLAREKYCSK